MGTLQLQVLGTFAAGVDGVPVSNFRSDKIRALLIFLAVEGDRNHQRETLADLLWPEMDRSAGLRNLRKSLSRLRETLGREASEQLLRVTRQTIGIAPDSCEVDLLAFQRRLAAVARHEHETPTACTHCLAQLEKGVAAYGGPLLDNFLPADTPGFVDWMGARRADAQQQYLGALDVLTSAALERASWEQAIQYGRRQLAAEPWRESAHRQLMQAYAALGRIDDVRRQYENCRERLQAELGAAPTAETSALFQKLLTSAAVGHRPVPNGTPTRRRIRLPRQFTSFVGREQALADIERRLNNPNCGLLTLLGPGGVGKTRVAVEAARRRAERYRDGVLFVPLETVGEAGEIPSAILDAVDLPRGSRQESRTQLLSYLQEKELLLILDNVEHLLPGGALLVEILRAAPGVQLLVTSRVTLNLRAEWLYELDGLATPQAEAEQTADEYPAVTLFLERVGQIQAVGELSGRDLAGMVRICRLVEGVPLAIELAASQVRAGGVARVADELAQSMDAIGTEMMDVPPRHRSMRAVFSYSWQLLDAPEREILMAMSVFSGGFDMAAATAVSGAGAGQIRRLQEKSFFSQSATDRYGMHEVLRQYAREALAAAGQEGAALRRHSDYYLTLLTRRQRSMLGAAGKQEMDGLQRELGNMLQAWDEACRRMATGLLLRSQYGLSQFLHLRGLLPQGLRAFGQAVAAVEKALPAGGPADAAERRLLSRLLNAQAGFLLNQGEPDAARTVAERSLALARRGGFLFEEAGALVQLGIVHTDQSRYQEAHRAHDTAEAILTGLATDETADAWTVRSLRSTNFKQKCDAYWELGEFEQAKQCLDQALALDRANGDVRGEASCYHRQGIIARIQSDYGQATAYFQQSMRLARQSGYSRLQHLLRSSLALTYSDTGDNETARGYFLTFYETSREMGDLTSQLTGLINLGLVAARVGYDLEARAHYEEALRISRQTGNRRNEGIVAGNLGVVAMRLGHMEEARQLLTDSLAARLAISDRTGEMYSRYYLARLALLEGGYEAAAEQCRQVLALEKEGPVRDIGNLARTALAHAYVKQGRLAEAEALYREASGGWQETGQIHLQLAPLAGLARLALAAGNGEEALRLCSVILEKAPGRNLESTFEPFDIWLTCIEVLRAVDDPRAGTVLADVAARLGERAERIGELEIRARFLAANPAHIAIGRLARRAQSSP